MKTLIVYMVSCCLLLFGGYRYAHAGAHFTDPHARPHKVEKAPQMRFDEFANKDGASLTVATPIQDKFNIVRADDEDEDADFGRKLAVPSRSLLVMVYAAFLLFSIDKIKSSLLPGGLVSIVNTGYSPVLSALRI